MVWERRPSRKELAIVVAATCPKLPEDQRTLLINDRRACSSRGAGDRPHTGPHHARGHALLLEQLAQEVRQASFAVPHPKAQHRY